jgi:hypothetical protein
MCTVAGRRNRQSAKDDFDSLKLARRDKRAIQAALVVLPMRNFIVN